ncbi:MAG: hypothetical protein MRY83_19150 [Flavobacteriales bacterium]|nr:hypothetical protein [Flavobacteriales bacterium]
MTLPQKNRRRKRLRKIIVDNISYYWKFERLDRVSGIAKATVGLESHPYKRITVSGYGLHGIEDENTGLERNFSIVKPKIIEKAIKFAIVNGWTTSANNLDLTIKIIDPKLETYSFSVFNGNE